MGSPGGTQAGVDRWHGTVTSVGQPTRLHSLPYVLIELFRQFLDMTQDSLGVVLFCPHPCYLVGHQLGEEA